MAEARVNGVRLYYELHGHGDPMVCLHGLQGDSSHFRGLLPALSRAHQVLVFDQRGSGRSDKPRMDLTTVESSSDWLPRAASVLSIRTRSGAAARRSIGTIRTSGSPRFAVRR